ncbi:MAG TPA: PepSY domain-containing protein [Gemmatimonadales bacterium]
MKNRTMTSINFGLVAVLSLVTGGGLAAQQPAAPAYKRDVPAALLSQARISEDSARTLALKRVPGSAVKQLELEREHGLLIWSFDLTVAGKPGVEEVEVDALTGKIVGVEHEAN